MERKSVLPRCVIHAHKTNELTKHKDDDFDVQQNVILFADTVEDDHPLN
jgi:hypothetical protein